MKVLVQRIVMDDIGDSLDFDRIEQKIDVIDVEADLSDEEIVQRAHDGVSTEFDPNGTYEIHRIESTRTVELGE